MWLIEACWAKFDRSTALSIASVTRTCQTIPIVGQVSVQLSKYPSLNKIFATFPRAPGWHNVLANSLYLVAMFSKLATLRGPVAAGSGIPSTPPHPHTPSRLRPQTSIASDVRSGVFEKKIDDILCKVFHLWDKYLQFDAIANTLEGE